MAKSLKYYQSLEKKRDRIGKGVFLVEGERAIRQVGFAAADRIIEVMCTDGAAPRWSSYPLRIMTSRQIAAVSSWKTPQDVIAVVRIPEEAYSDRLPENPGRRVLLLEDIQDPGNTGTLVRTAAALGFGGVILTEATADLFSPKCVQSSAGSVLSLWSRRTIHYLRMVRELKERRYFIAAASLEGNQGPDALSGRASLVLALGNEATGLSRELLACSDAQIRIPIDREKAESLNVAASGAILMHASLDGVKTA